MRLRRSSKKRDIPDGILRKCNHCKEPIFVAETEENNYMCPKCGGYFRMPARDRIALLADTESFVSWDIPVDDDKLGVFPGYRKKHRDQSVKYGLDEAILTGQCTIMGERTALAVCDGRFFMASMGRVMGERITNLVQRAGEEDLPVIIVTCSGGARMQEGIHSLMQMAKTSGAIDRYKRGGGLYISVLTDPTYGGVTASYAMQGDIILAEKHAMIGFAGQRVIAQTVKEKLPKGFQSAEFLYDHGQIDAIVERDLMREDLAAILRLHAMNGTGSDHKNSGCSGLSHKDTGCFGSAHESTGAPETSRAKCLADDVTEARMKTVSVWERVQLSRQRERPVFEDYLYRLFPDFIRMAGDRIFGEDAAIIGGIASLNGRAVTVIGEAKGRTTAEQVQRRFGMPRPEGYEKVGRLISQAEKFARPVICFVDTPGADCGIEAEKRGQGGAIARLLAHMMRLQVPVLSIIIGEGGSGGALALACGNEVWMLENATYSILSPEGFASILWKDASQADEAAKLMGMTAQSLYEEGIIDRIIPEPSAFTCENIDEVIIFLQDKIQSFMIEYESMDGIAVEKHRFARFLSM